MSSFETIVYEVERGRARITLNRPEKRNALSGKLMGARTLQRLAIENDARAHLAVRGGGFTQLVREKGLKTALRERDAKFGDGRARVDGPELRDAEGRLKG
jgi:enoyl-CoA hydratase